MRSFTLLPILVLVLLSTPVQGVETKALDVFRFGVSTVSFQGLNQNDTAAALKAWSMAIVKETGLKMRAEMTVFTRYADLREAFLAKRLDAATLNVAEIMALNVWPEVVFLPAMEGIVHVRYALIAHRDDNFPDAQAIVGRKLVMHASSRMVLAVSWLETVMAGAGRESLESKTNLPLPEPIDVESPSKAIFQVYFHQADAAVVTMDAFKLACDLNPQLGQTLRVMAVSPPFVPTVFIFQPTYPDPYRQIMEQTISQMHTTLGGRQLLTTFQSSSIERYPVSVLDSTRQFLITYRNLRQKGDARVALPQIE